MASGAFSNAKPTDLIPELLGRLPIRVELKPLSKQVFSIEILVVLKGGLGYDKNLDRNQI